MKRIFLNAFPVFQYVGEGKAVNQTTPSIFQPKKIVLEKYSPEIAYYVAEAAVNREFLMARKDDAFREEAATVLLFYRALDHVESITTKERDRPIVRTSTKYGTSFEEQYRFYREINSWVLCDLAESIAAKHLWPFAKFFDAEFSEVMAGDLFIFPNPEGIAKLKAEWPDIAKEFSELPA